MFSCTCARGKWEVVDRIEVGGSGGARSGKAVVRWGFFTGRGRVKWLRITGTLPLTLFNYDWKTYDDWKLFLDLSLMF